MPCCLLKGPLKYDFLDNYVTTFFGGLNFENTSAIRVIKFKLDLKNAKKKKKKKKKKKNLRQRFFVFERIASELVTLNCLY